MTTLVFVFCPHFWRWPPFGLCTNCQNVYDLIRVVKMTAPLSEKQIRDLWVELDSMVERPEE